MKRYLIIILFMILMSCNHKYKSYENKKEIDPILLFKNENPVLDSLLNLQTKRVPYAFNIVIKVFNKSRLYYFVGDCKTFKPYYKTFNTNEYLQFIKRKLYYNDTLKIDDNDFFRDNVEYNIINENEMKNLKFKLNEITNVNTEIMYTKTADNKNKEIYHTYASFNEKAYSSQKEELKLIYYLWINKLYCISAKEEGRLFIENYDKNNPLFKK